MAEEIRKLAEQSSQTVVRIQDTTKEVLKAVEDLKKNSSNALNFIDSYIVKAHQDTVEVLILIVRMLLIIMIYLMT